MLPVELLQVQYLVAFIVKMLGQLTGYIADALGFFAVDLVAAGADAGTMQNLTTGIFGTNSGLILWMNDKVFYMVEFMPWTDLSFGLGCLLDSILFF